MLVLEQKEVTLDILIACQDVKWAFCSGSTVFCLDVMLSGQHHCFSTTQMTNEEGIQEEQLNIMTKVTELFFG